LEIVELGDATVLMEHLGQRERLWHEFELLEQQLAPHKGILPERRIWQNAEERHLTELTLNRCKALLEEIMANDQISMEKTAARRDNVEEQLRRIQRTGTVAPAYLKQSRGV
jgi:septal ring factor EnvC (AmiA/AmiB activator)